MKNNKQFDPQTFHDGVDTTSQAGISYLAAMQQLFIENVGGLAFYSIDTIFGGLAFALAADQQVGAEFQVGGYRFTLLLIVMSIFSFAISALQYRLWRNILRTEDWRERWKSIIFGGVVALVETGVDGTIVEWFYGGSPMAWPRPMAQTSFLYWATWILVILVCGLNEPLIELFKNQGYRTIMNSVTPRPAQVQTRKPQRNSGQRKKRQRQSNAYAAHSRK